MHSRVSRIAAAAELLAHGWRSEAARALCADSPLRESMALWALDASVSDCTRGALEAVLLRGSLENARIRLLLARSVPVAPWRALVYALLRGAAAIEVRAPSAQREFCGLCVRAMRASGLPVSLSEAPRESFVGEGAYDALLAYGSDKTIEKLLRAAPSNVYVECRGHGLALAVVRGGDHAENARALARDVAAYDQFGCLSPRLVLFAGENPEGFVRSLSAALECVPWERAPLDVGLAVEVHAWSTRAALSGALVLRGKTSVVTLEAPAEPPRWSPGARCIAVHPCSDESLRSVLASVTSLLTCVGVAGKLPDEVPVGEARVVSLGTMQTPLLAWGYEDPRAPSTRKHQTPMNNR